MGSSMGRKSMDIMMVRGIRLIMGLETVEIMVIIMIKGEDSIMIGITIETQKIHRVITATTIIRTLIVITYLNLSKKI